jgi:hypothetical protein
VSVLGGTGIGGFIGVNSGLIYGIFTGYFIVGIGVAMYLLNRKRSVGDGEACELPRRTQVRFNGLRIPGQARLRRAKN